MSKQHLSERPESKFEVLHNAYQLRKFITDWLMLDFGIIPPEFPSENTEQNSSENLNLTSRQKFRLEQYNGFCTWFQDYMRNNITNQLRALVNHLTVANSIFPVYLSECDLRHIEQDKAIASCFCLLQEFQYLAETLQVDLNKYTTVTKYIDKEISLIKGWRKSDNSIRNKIKEKEQKQNMENGNY